MKAMEIYDTYLSLIDADSIKLERTIIRNFILSLALPHLIKINTNILDSVNEALGIHLSPRFFENSLNLSVSKSSRKAKIVLCIMKLVEAFPGKSSVWIQDMLAFTAQKTITFDNLLQKLSHAINLKFPDSNHRVLTALQAQTSERELTFAESRRLLTRGLYFFSNMNCENSHSISVINACRNKLIEKNLVEVDLKTNPFHIPSLVHSSFLEDGKPCVSLRYVILELNMYSWMWIF